MHPILVSIGGWGVATWDVLLLVGFMVGIGVARRRAEARGLDGARCVDLGLVVLVTSIAGARTLWVATHVEQFRSPYGTWLDAVNPLQSDGSVGLGGLSMLGGVLCALGGAVAYLRAHRLPVAAYLDVMAPSVALGEAITRLGCFLGGCCRGAVTNHAWGVALPSTALPLHPAPLYAAAGSLVLVAVLLRLARHEVRPGVVASWFLVLAGLQRIALDVVRHQEASALVGQLGDVPVALSQLLSLGLVTLGAAALLRHHGAPWPLGRARLAR